LRAISALLLLSVLCFSFSSSLHYFWHHPVDPCANTAHSCRNQRAGITGDAWQQPLHAPINFHPHSFDCPLCSGLTGTAENQPANLIVCLAPVTEKQLFSAEKFVFSRYLYNHGSRAPPA